MFAHRNQFDEKLSKLARNEACGLPKSAGMSKTKLSQGEIKFGYEISEDLRRDIIQKWSEVVEPETGCATYDELRKQMSSV